MNINLLAAIYDLKGDKLKAKITYENIIAKDPNNRDAQLYFKRLSSPVDMSNINKKIIHLFISIRHINRARQSFC